MEPVPCFDIVEHRNILNERIKKDITGWCISWKRTKYSKRYYFTISEFSKRMLKDNENASIGVGLIDFKPIADLFKTKEEAEDMIKYCKENPDKFIILQ